MINLELCLALMRADTEQAVIDLLMDAGYWDDPNVWRDLGDDENNYAIVGNQQAEAVAAMIEKVVNCVDSRLINACLELGIDPTSPDAPQSIKEAVAWFFENKKGKHISDQDGRVAYWTDSEATAQSRLITVSATGNKPDEGSGYPSITIADQGEGQTPDAFPDTFMSLRRSNKLRIPFVQGKFNMGSTGALLFCSEPNRLQLIVSRRNPAIVAAASPQRDQEWGFSLVRRQPPAAGRRSSVFTYLAPVGADSRRKGDVLSFVAKEIPLFPTADARTRDAYDRPAQFGSLVKMYEYRWSGTRTNVIIARDGLLRRLDQGLPELALPVRVFECRPQYRGHAGSFATNLLGLSARLERDKAEKLESGFPRASLIDVDGRKVKVRVFAFVKDAADEYRTKRNAVIFGINGQLHASLSTDFFRRQAVGMNYLADSLLVMVDCTDIEGISREDLFMNSRDRLRENSVSRRLIEELEAFLHDEPALRELRNRRREQDLEEKLADSKPLASVLEDVLKKSPTLAKLFLKGVKLPSPFPKPNGAGTGGSGKGTSSEFKGKEYPTYFHVKGKRPGETQERDAHIGRRVRITFETDAEDEYFVRDLFPGERKVWRILDSGDAVPVTNTRMDGPKSGIATLLLDTPAEASVGEVITIEVEVTDEMRVDPFVNRILLNVRPAESGGGGGGGGRRPANSGSGAVGGDGLALPNIIPVRMEDYNSHPFHTFTEDDALYVVPVGSDDSDAESYDFYVNVDNKYLRTVEKESREDPKLLEAKFTYSLVLVGLALIHDQDVPTVEEDGDHTDESLEARVARVTTAIAPVLLPMVETIGGLSLDEDG